MKFTKAEVFQMCDRIAPEYGFEPSLIKAIALQEGGKNKDGTFAPDVARLEQGFYRKYVESQNDLATTSEILLAASYGIMQLMGLSLKEAGFFQFYFDQCDPTMKLILKSPFSQLAIPSALDAYCVNLEWMIRYGCEWLARKRNKAKGNIPKMLSYWNGDMTGKYALEVLDKQKILIG